MRTGIFVQRGGVYTAGAGDLARRSGLHSGGLRLRQRLPWAVGDEARLAGRSDVGRKVRHPEYGVWGQWWALSARMTLGG